MGNPELSVVIISRDDRDYLRRCLNALSALDKEAVEIILVDNASTDGTVEMVRDRFPRVRLTVNRRNLGVARARNQAVALARGDFFLILDSDTAPREGAVESLLEFIKSRPEAGLVAPRLVDPDGNTQLTCRFFPTLWTTVCRRLDRFAFFRRQPALAEQMMSGWDHGSVREVQYVIGACQLIRREAWDNAGPLDERIFFGPEDIDFCIALGRAGWRIIYYPRAVVEHAEKRHTKGFFRFSHWRHVWGVLYFFNKHRFLLGRRSAGPVFSSEGEKGQGKQTGNRAVAKRGTGPGTEAFN
jgi:GT2 family glycosyltransferase